MILFILQHISITNIILSNNVYNINTACLLLHSYFLTHLYMVIFCLSFFLFFFFNHFFVFVVVFVVPLNATKK